MRRWINTKILCSGCFRFVMDSQSFFELYGRIPETVVEYAIHVGSTDASDFSTVGMPAKWVKALDELSAQLYAEPQRGISRLGLRSALETIVETVVQVRDRRSRCSQHLWERALDVWHHAENGRIPKEVDLHGFALLMTVLYYGGKIDYVVQQVESHWMKLSPRAENESETCYTLRSMTLYVLASSAGRKCLRTSMMERMREVMEGAFHLQKTLVATTITHECKILLYALDWHFVHVDDLVGRQFLSSTFILLTPKRLRTYMFTATPVGVSDALVDVPPAAVLRAGVDYAKNGEKERLWRLFTECKQVEKGMKGFQLFNVSTRLGEMFSMIPGVESGKLSKVVAFCGSSLNYESLKTIGMTQGCHSAVLQVLGCMEGPEAYFAARQVLFHHTPLKASAFQETHGDVLLGDARLTWRNALQSMSEFLAQGDMSWRDVLPTVLRLLSDAGENTRFFRLLKETYMDDERASLITASALGQAIRRTGQWSRASEVFDMIISCNPPYSAADDLFLQDACLQTIYALRDAKRWKEALAFYSSLAPVMPQAAHRVVCSAVCDAPVSSAWERALATVQTFGDVPEKFLTTLLCARDPDRVPVVEQNEGRYSWRYMLQGYAEGGHWRHALLCVQGRKELGFGACLLLLRSAQRSPLGLLTRDFFDCLQAVWSHPEHLRLCVLVAEAHGYLKELYNSLEKHRDNPLDAEYHALVGFLMDGIFPSSEMLFTDTYVIHRLLMSPIPSGTSMRIAIVWTEEAREAFNCRYRKDMKKFAQFYLKVHPSCVPKLQCKGEQDIFMLQTISPLSCLEGKGDYTLLTMQEDLIVAYKPPGVVTQSCSRSVVYWSKATKMHSLAYLLSPPSCGLILLLRSTIPTKAVHLKMKVVLRIYPMDSLSLPLLSTKFFEAYKMMVLEGPSVTDGSLLVVAVCRSDPDGLLAGSLYRLKEAIDSERWAFWKVDSNSSSGDSLHVAELTVSICYPYSDCGMMHFSTSPMPAWAHLTPDECPLE